MVYKKITYEERQYIESQLKKRNVTHTQIALHLNRDQSNISREIKKFGGNLNYSAKVSQDYAEKNEKEKVERILIHGKKYHPPYSKKFRHIQEQLDTIFDILEDLCKIKGKK